MTRHLPPHGARALRRTLSALDALAAPIAPLCAPMPMAGPDCVIAPLTQGPRLDALVAALDTLDGIQAPAPGRPTPRPTGRRPDVARPAAAAVRPRRTPSPEPGPLADRPTTAEAAAALRAAWPPSAPALRAATAVPPSAHVRRPLPPTSVEPLATLAASTLGAGRARIQPLVPRATPVAVAAKPARAGALGVPATEVAPAASAAPAPVDGARRAPPSVAAGELRGGGEVARAANPRDGAPPGSRGLARLASWWQQGQTRAPLAGTVSGPGDAVARAPAVASGLAEPVAAAPGQALGMGALTPSQRSGDAGRADREAPSLLSISNLDDVTRALERVLARELRRHGVTAEDA